MNLEDEKRTKEKEKNKKNGKVQKEKGEEKDEEELKIHLGEIVRRYSGWHQEERENKILCQLKEEGEKTNHLQRNGTVKEQNQYSFNKVFCT